MASQTTTLDPKALFFKHQNHSQTLNRPLQYLLDSQTIHNLLSTLD